MAKSTEHHVYNGGGSYNHEPALSDELARRLKGEESKCIFPLCNTCRELATLEITLRIAMAIETLSKTLAAWLKERG